MIDHAYSEDSHFSPKGEASIEKGGQTVVRSSVKSTLDLPFIKKSVRLRKEELSRTRRTSNFDALSLT